MTMRWTSTCEGRDPTARRATRWRRTASLALLISAPVVAIGCAEKAASPPPAAPGATTAAPVMSASAAPAASSAAAVPAPTPSASASAAEPPAPPDDEEEAKDELIEHQRHHHHGGVTRFIAMAIDTLGVLPEQTTTVEKIQSDLRQKLEPSRAADQAFMALLADEIAAGKIDKAKVDGGIAKIATATTKAQAASEDELRQLHDVLTPPQRTALVDKIEAHWHVWENANQTAEESEKAHEAGRLEHLSQELSLTPDQVDKIKTALQKAPAGANMRYDSKEVQSRIQAFDTAFSGDSFDAKALHSKGADSVDAHIASDGAARMAHFLEIVTPILTADQRAKLAQKLREHATEKSAAPGTWSE